VRIPSITFAYLFLAALAAEIAQKVFTKLQVYCGRNRRPENTISILYHLLDMARSLTYPVKLKYPQKKSILTHFLMLSV